MKVKRWTNYDMEDDNGMYVLAEDYDRLLADAKRLYEAAHVDHWRGHDDDCRLCEAVEDFRKRWVEDA